MQSYQRKKLTVFPVTEGWIKVENDRKSVLSVLIEPWASSHNLAPGEFCYVHLVSDGSEVLLRLSEDFLVAFCGDAIYQNGVEVIDFRD